MSENARMALIVVVFLTMGTFLWVFLSGDGGETDISTLPQPVTVDQKSAEIPDFDFDDVGDRASTVSRNEPSPTPDSDESESEMAQETNSQPQSSARRTVGAGKITVKLEMSDGNSVPGDLVVALHELSDKDMYDHSVGTLRDTKPASSEKEIEFTKLPLSQFGLMASSGTYTGTANRSLTKARPEGSVTLELFPTSVMSGNVINSNGEGIPNARIFVAGFSQSGSEQDAGVMLSRLTRVLADETGAFAIGNIQIREPALSFRLTASADGYGSKTTELYPPDSTNMSIVLDKGRNIEGIVVNTDSGDAMANVEVIFEGEPELNKGHTFTDETGAFSLASLGHGEYIVGIKNDLLVVTSESTKIEVTETLPDAPITIEVATGAIIEGRIYNETTGNGIPNVSIHGSPKEMPGAERKTVTTGNNGEYRLVGLKTGTYEVRFDEVEGYPRRGTWEKRKEVATTLSNTIGGIDFALTQGLTISGIVVDNKGKPLEKVNVNGNKPRGGRDDYAQTKADGRFTLSGFKPNTEIRVIARKDDLAAVPEMVTLEEESYSGLRIEMIPDAKVSGVIVDHSGNPVPEARLYARAIGGANANLGGYIRDVNGKGEFTLGGLIEGTYGIHLYRDGSSGNNIAEKVTLTKGEHREGLRLLWDFAEGMTVSGRVLNEDGKGIRYASLQLQGPGWGNTQTDTNGNFKFADVKDGSFSISVTATGYTKQTIQQIVAGTEGLEIIMAPAGSISGQIIAAATGEPVQDFSILLLNAGEGFNNNNFKSFHHDEGAYTIKNVYAGNATLTVRADGYAETLHQVTGVVSGQTTENIQIALNAGVLAHGRVTNSAGEPLSGAGIFVGPVPSNEWERERNTKATTNNSGEFTLDSLSAGEIQLSAYAAGYTFGSTTTNLSLNGNNQINIVLGSGGTVEGYVTLNKEPFSGANAYINGNINGSNFNENATTNAEGFYSFKGLPDGVLNLGIHFNDGESQRSMNRQVEVADGMVTDLNFAFEPGNSSVEGYIYVGENETSAGQVSLTITTGAENESRSMEAGSDGYYLFEGIPAGDVSIRAWNTSAGNMNRKQATGTLGNNERLRLDLLLYGGTTIRCLIQNAPDAKAVYAMLLSGKHEMPPEIDQTSIQSFANNMVSQVVVDASGIAELKGVNVGEYTLLILPVNNESNPFPILNFRSQFVTVNNEEEQDITISF